MKKFLQFLTLAITAFSTLPVFAQFTLPWSDYYQHSGGLDFSNEVRKVAVNTAAGHIYTLSDVTSNIDLAGNVTTNTYSYCLLHEYDLTGAEIDVKTFDVGQHVINGFDQRSGFGLEVDASGNVYVAYMSYNANSSYDINFVKYTGQLNLAWTYKFNPTTEDYGIQMQVSQGNMFAVVKSIGGGNTRYRIIKGTAQGTSTTALYTYSSQPDFLAGLAVDASQKIYTTGYRQVGGAKSILISCVNGSGTLLWSKVDNCGTTTGDDFSRDIHWGHDNYLYITGSSQGTVQHGVDAFIMKYNPANGKKMWESFINLNLADGGFLVRTSSTDNVYAAWSAGNTTYVDMLSSTDGTQQRRITYAPVPLSPYSSLSGVTITDLKVSDHNYVYLCGYINAANAGQNFTAGFLTRSIFTARGLPQIVASLPVVGDFNASYKNMGIALNDPSDALYMIADQISTFTSHASEGIWLHAVEVPAPLRQMNDAITPGAPVVSVYPNPVINELFVNSETELTKIEIYDISGKLVMSNPASGFSFEVKNLDIGNGIYFIRITDTSGIITSQKITKY